MRGLLASATSPSRLIWFGWTVVVVALSSVTIRAQTNDTTDFPPYTGTDIFNESTTAVVPVTDTDSFNESTTQMIPVSNTAALTDSTTDTAPVTDTDMFIYRTTDITPSSNTTVFTDTTTDAAPVSDTDTLNYSTTDVTPVTDTDMFNDTDSNTTASAIYTADCDFEAGGFCDYTNEHGADLVWYRTQGATASFHTGPQADHTYGNSTGHYVYFETSVGVSGHSAILRSRLITTQPSMNSRLSFWYHMYGAAIGWLSVQIQYADGSNRTLLEMFTNRGDLWQKAIVDIPHNGQDFYILFNATRFYSDTGDISIDDIQFLGTEPPTPTPMCLPGQWYCYKSTLCIDSRQVCDFNHDCANSTEDEDSCSKSCNFDTGECNWKNAIFRDFLWYRHSGNTSTPGTGPSVDHTTGTVQGYYMYTEGITMFNGAYTNYESTNFQRTGPACRLNFWYHMNGDHQGHLSLAIWTGFRHKDVLWSTSGNLRAQSDYWRLGSAFIGTRYNFSISFEQIRGGGELSDVAIDDIQFINCAAPKTIQACTASQFTCKNRNCVPLNAACDDANNCGDNSDEVGCPMYNGDCDFETSMCNWKNTGGDKLDWTHHSGSTPTLSTGPRYDHTLGYVLGHYMYIEASVPHNNTDYALLVTDTYYPPTTDGNCHIRFYYHILGYGSGWLALYTETNTSIRTNVWTTYSHQGNIWHRADVIVDSTEPYRFVFNGTIVTHVYNDFALDDISLTKGCIEGSPQVCPAGQWYCTKSKICIDSRQVCDFNNDCGISAEDEEHCSKPCDFERGECNWDNSINLNHWHHYWWERIAGTSGAIGTGPSSDHTRGIPQGHYMYADSKYDSGTGWVANYQSRTFQRSGPLCSIHFWYHMYGQNQGQLSVLLWSQGGHREVIWATDRDQGDAWKYGTAHIGARYEFSVGFEGILGGEDFSDLALDDINFTDCAASKPILPCTRSEFECQNRNCVPLAQVCDDANNCGDSSDEQGCPSYVGDCDFETDLCVWRNVAGDRHEWQHLQGNTPTTLTGPNYDHTRGNNEGHFVYVEASGPSHTLGDNALLVTNYTYPATTDSSCHIRFYYHMYGNRMGNLSLFLEDDFSVRTLVWSKSGDQGYFWHRADVTVRSTSPYHYVLEGVVGTGSAGDIAVDDISLTRGCLHGRPPIVLDPPSNVALNEGGDARFTCTASGYPGPNITWLHNGTALGMSSAVSITETVYNGSLLVLGSYGIVSTLLLHNVTNNAHQGSYTCWATNAGLTDDARSAFLSVHVPPVVITPLEDIIAVEGTNITFTCNIHGIPFPSVQWYYNDQDMSASPALADNRVHLSVSGKVLTIINVQFRDRGQYYCHGNNTDTSGMLGGTVNSMKATLTVHVHPQLQFITPSLEVLKDDLIRIICLYNSYPLPSVTIIAPGYSQSRLQSLGMLHPAEGMLSNGILWRQVTLQIPAASRSDNGTYTCTAVTPAGNATDQTSVTVYEVPDAPAPPVTQTNAPYIIGIQWSEPRWNNAPITHYQVEYVHIDCHGNTMSNTTNATASARVMSFTVSPNIDCTYRVRAVNRIGVGNLSKALTLRSHDISPTGSPVDIVARVLTFEHVNTSWSPPNCSLEQGLIIQYQILYEDIQSMATDSVNVTGSSIRSALVTGLSPYTAYRFTVRMFNSNGFGPYSAPFETRTLTINNQYPPEAHALQAVVIGVQNTPVRLEMNLTHRGIPALPSTNISWSLGSQSSSTGQIDLTMFASGDGLTLQLPSMNYSLAGQICACLHHDAATVKVNFTLLYDEPAYVIQGPSPVNINAGQILTLHCIARGKPAPNITWYRDGFEMSHSFYTTTAYQNQAIDERGSKGVESTLLTSVVYGVHGGVYVCRATNEHLPDSSAQSVVKIFVPPTELTPPSDVTEHEDRSATFSCSMYAVNSPDITWYHNNSFIIDPLVNPRVSLSNGNASLTISPLFHNDSGSYNCIAENGNVRLGWGGVTIGTAAYLTVLDRPTCRIANVEHARIATGRFYPGDTTNMTCYSGFVLQGNGTLTCNSSLGWNTMSSSCQDINECTSDIHNCPMNSTCSNSPGSFTCDCFSGFVQSSSSGLCSACVLPWRQLAPGSRYCGYLPGVSDKYDMAISYCASLTGGDAWLPRVRRQRDNNAISGFLSSFNTNQVWLGTDDRQMEGNFLWTDTQENLTYTNWIGGEPSNTTGSEDCVVISTTGTWTARHCNMASTVLCVRDMPTCSVPQIQNGGISSGVQFYPGTAANVTCNPGTLLTGSEIITCNDSLQWHPALPTCLGDVTKIAIAGQSTTMHCDLPLIEHATVSWYRNKQKLYQDDLLGRVSFHLGDHILTIFRPELSDTGTYHCTTMDTGGTGNVATVQGNYTIFIVHTNPSIVPPLPKSITSFSGARLEVKGSFLGNPEPDAEWCLTADGECNGVDTENCSAVHTTSTPGKAELLFPSVHTCHSTVYTLTVNNSLGTISAQIHIPVKEQTRIGLQGIFNTANLRRRRNLEATNESDAIEQAFSTLLRMLIPNRLMEQEHFEYDSSQGPSSVLILVDLVIPAEFLTAIDANVSIPKIRANLTARLLNPSMPLQVNASSFNLLFYDQCASETTYGGIRGNITWPQTFIGTDITVQCPIAVHSNLIRYTTRTCGMVPRPHNANLTWGLWSAANLNHCPSAITVDLYKLSKARLNTSNPFTILDHSIAVSNLTSFVQNLIADDVDYATSSIYNAVSTVSKGSNFNSTYIKLIANATLRSVDNILDVNSTIILPPPAARVAKAMEKLMTIVPLEQGEVFQAYENNVGFALACHVPSSVNESLHSHYDRVANRFYINTNFTSGVIPLVSLVIPGSAISQATERLPNSSRINCPIAPTALILYRSHEFFVDSQLYDNTTVTSDIISVQIGQEELEHLREPFISTFDLPYAVPTGKDDEVRCVSWDFKLADGIGGWTEDGCEVLEISTSRNQTTCRCNHLTHFAVLLVRSSVDSTDLPPVEEKVLKYISIIGTALSMVGLLCTNIAILLIKKLRQGHHHQMVFGLCTTLLLFLSIFMLILYYENLPQHGLACKALAIAMHFLLLSSFVWTSVDATFLYKQIVIVFDETKQSVRYTLHSLVFVLPLIVVAVSAGLTLPDGYGGENICWIRSDPVFYGALVAPMALCLGYNLVILVIVVVTLQRRGKNLATASTNANKGKKALLRTVVSISILLGLTWVFGFLVLADDNIVFQYVFAVLNCLQGVFIFVHVIRGQDAKKGVEEIFSSRKSTTGSSTKSTGLISLIRRGRYTRTSSKAGSGSSGSHAKKGKGEVRGVRGIKGGSSGSNGNSSKIPDSAQLSTLERVKFRTPVSTNSAAGKESHATSLLTPTPRPTHLATTLDRHGKLVSNLSQTPTTDDEQIVFVHSQTPVDLPDIGNLLSPESPTSDWRQSFELSPINSASSIPPSTPQDVPKPQRTQSFRNFKFEQYKSPSGDIYAAVDLASKASSESKK
eukprot:scpid2178/ scgid30914/ MAM and LDL-receptor class A domain-containing protein C10orf112